MGHGRFKRCVDPAGTFTHPSRGSDYPDKGQSRFMTRRMPRPEDVSRDHIDATVVMFLKGERDLNWTEMSLVTLHPREEIRLVLKANLDRYRTVNEGRFSRAPCPSKTPRRLPACRLQVAIWRRTSSAVGFGGWSGWSPGHRDSARSCRDTRSKRLGRQFAAPLRSLKYRLDVGRSVGMGDIYNARRLGEPR